MTKKQLTVSEFEESMAHIQSALDGTLDTGHGGTSVYSLARDFAHLIDRSIQKNIPKTLIKKADALLDTYFDALLETIRGRYQDAIERASSILSENFDNMDQQWREKTLLAYRVQIFASHSTLRLNFAKQHLVSDLSSMHSKETVSLLLDIIKRRQGSYMSSRACNSLKYVVSEGGIKLSKDDKQEIFELLSPLADYAVNQLRAGALDVRRYSIDALVTILKDDKNFHDDLCTLIEHKIQTGDPEPAVMAEVYESASILAEPTLLDPLLNDLESATDRPDHDGYAREELVIAITSTSNAAKLPLIQKDKVASILYSAYKKESDSDAAEEMIKGLASLKTDFSISCLINIAGKTDLAPRIKDKDDMQYTALKSLDKLIKDKGFSRKSSYWGWTMSTLVDLKNNSKDKDVQELAGAMLENHASKKDLEEIEQKARPAPSYRFISPQR